MPESAAKLGDSLKKLGQRGAQRCRNTQQIR